MRMAKLIGASMVMALLLSGPAVGVSGLPNSIKLTDGRFSTCYVWTDPVKVDEKPLEPENYPVQTTFFAKKAIPGNCGERHHFQIFYRKPILASSSNVFRNALTPALCRKKAKSTLTYNELSKYIYAAKVGNKKEGFFSACLMAGSVRMGSNSKTYFFEELFESRVRSVSN
jgi:hypothetical protein